MYLWRKLADRWWLAANETALRAFAGNQLAIIERPPRKRLQIELGSKSSRKVQTLVDQFGGRIEKLPRDWLKRYLRKQKAKPLNIGDKTLLIPAGAAFGTGEHATTAMCLRLLERVIVDWGADASRVRSPIIVDLGTGSGILALAASLLGAKRIVAIDLDPMAITTAKQNARRNKIDNVQFRLVDVRRWNPPRDVDIVTANLFSELLVEILPKLRRVSCLILSGIFRDQEVELTRALKRNKVDIREVRRRGKWVAVLAGQLRRS
jgi:ribosomal protein L11 methyltransferase